MRLMGIHHCLSAVARQLGVRVQRIEAIYHFHTRHLLDPPLAHVCANVGYEQTSTRKGHEYITTFVDLDTAQVIDIQDGKGAEAVEKFFRGHPYPQALLRHLHRHVPGLHQRGRELLPPGRHHLRQVARDPAALQAPDLDGLASKAGALGASTWGC